jgi:hypothetical protein
MKIEAARVGLAVGIGSAILWTLCSLLVAAAPEPSLAITRRLFHVVSGGPAWGVTWGGYLGGLFVWSVGSGFFAWLCAFIYNRMPPARER